MCFRASNYARPTMEKLKALSSWKARYELLCGRNFDKIAEAISDYDAELCSNVFFTSRHDDLAYHDRNLSLLKAKNIWDRMSNKEQEGVYQKLVKKMI
jgi:hypothetical protein